MSSSHGAMEDSDDEGGWITVQLWRLDPSDQRHKMERKDEPVDPDPATAERKDEPMDPDPATSERKDEPMDPDPATRKDVIVISDDENDPNTTRTTLKTNARPLPRLPPRTPGARVPSYGPYCGGQYMRRHCILLHSRIMENGDLRVEPGRATISTDHIWNTDFQELPPEKEWSYKDVESNGVDSLRGTNWLTGDVLNLAMCLLNNRQELPDHGDREPTPRCIFGYSYFTQIMIKRDSHGNTGHNQKIGGRYNWSEADLFIVPHNSCGNHWVLIVVYLREKKIVLYNSFKAELRSPVYEMERYLQNEGKHRGIESMQGTWTKANVIPPQIPLQSDGTSCGLFTIAAADCIARGRPPSGYDQESLKGLRSGFLKLLGFGN